MITISKPNFYVTYLFKVFGTWSYKPSDNIIRDHIKRLPLYSKKTNSYQVTFVGHIDVDNFEVTVVSFWNVPFRNKPLAVDVDEGNQPVVAEPNKSTPDNININYNFLTIVSNCY